MAAAPAPEKTLQSLLAPVLPKDHRFDIFHISTPPSRCDPLYAPPPNERPERTYCEKHFLAACIDEKPAAKNGDSEGAEAKDPRRVLVLGIEVFIFTTARATTIFVSKADSTGYLHLLGLPRGTPSPIREICAEFVHFLVENRRRQGVQLIVSLFARAQSQYLFPGSVDNKGKHVLDDRALVKWWCRVLDPVLVEQETARGYLVVPGLDEHDTRAYVPRGTAASGRWVQGHPLERISRYTREFDWVPPRCLIPRFPDDPKSRFRDELDEDAGQSKLFRTTGSWETVKTLDMFWEMMAYRQECSSGRMTGFIWVVFDDVEDKKKEEDAPAHPESQAAVLLQTPKANRTINITPTTTPRKLFPRASKSSNLDEITSEAAAKEDPKKKKDKKKKSKQTRKRWPSGPVIPRAPKAKTAQRNYLLDQAESTAYYSWTPSGRGERIFSENDYKRIHELLLHLDFSTLDKATGSTRRWLGEVAMGARWGYAVTGTRELPAPTEAKTDGAGAGAVAETKVNNLTGLVKRKRNVSSAGVADGAVNVLGAGLVRKKPKAEE